METDRDTTVFKTWPTSRAFPAQAANGSLLAAFANEGGRKKPGHASTLEKTEECAVCLLHRKDAVLAPCGHMCACFRCATRLRPGQEKGDSTSLQRGYSRSDI